MINSYPTRYTSCSPCYLASDVQRELARVNRLLLIEVQAALDAIIDAVIEGFCVGDPKRNRQRIPSEKRVMILDAYSRFKEEGARNATAITYGLREVSGLPKLNAKQVRRWMNCGPCKKVGRQVNLAFERQVLDELVFTQVAKVENEEQATVVANFCYSYNCIVEAAQMVQQRSEWAADDKASSLTRPWVRCWLRRIAMRPRRITAQLKEMPTPEVVQERMTTIQAFIEEKGISLENIFSGDESGMFYGAPPRLQYVPRSADRALAPESDDKSRFTTFLYGSAGGKMQATFNIIKCHSSDPYDLSRTTIMSTLHATSFTTADGWVLKQWERTLNLPEVRQKGCVARRCIRPYIMHVERGHVITCHNQAWMDTAGIACYVV